MLSVPAATGIPASISMRCGTAVSPPSGSDRYRSAFFQSWYTGIVVFNSDYAFTVTNVIIHGVPYMALVYWYARAQRPRAARPYRFLTSGLVPFLLTLWLIAYVEELFWDRGVWHERAWLFGSGWDIGMLKIVLVPLLALPQLTHYVLDGFIWRRKSNPNFSLIR